MDNNNTLTLWEEKNLIELTKNLENKRELETFGITKNMESKCEKIECANIGNSKRRCWSKDEIDKLSYFYQIEGKSLSELISLFPNRTKESIDLKIGRLKLRHTKEQQQKIWSAVRLGNKNPMFKKIPKTKGHTKNTLLCLKLGAEKLSKTIQEKIIKGEWVHTQGNKNGMYGKPSWSRGLTKNTCEKLKIASKKCSKTKKEKYRIEEHPFLGKHHTEESKYKMRLSAIKRMKRDGVLCCKNFNPKACEFIDKLNKEKGWNLQHAMNGGEVELYGYFVDGYDKERNIIFEYDEPRHETSFNKKRDEMRQNNLINLFKCQFYRYKELYENLINIST